MIFQSGGKDPIATGGGETDLPPEYMFYLQYHLVRQREIELNKMLGPFRLTISKWRILSTLARLGRSTMGEVADFCAIDRTTLTRIMDQLCTDGYVDRVTDARDRRQTLLDLTEHGAGIYHEAAKEVIVFNDKAIQGIDAADAQVVERVLRQVVSNVIEDPVWAATLMKFEKPAP